ncbi:MAG: hypothetical protein ACLFWB_08820 [Armatimonadota bacterium]
MSSRYTDLLQFPIAFLALALMMFVGCERREVQQVEPSPVIPTLAETYEMPTRPVVRDDDFNFGWRIWVVNIYTGKAWLAGEGMMPLWSPDGEFLAIQTRVSTGQYGITLVGERVAACNVRVTHSPFHYAWSSDGRSIIYDPEKPYNGQPPHTLERMKIGPGRDIAKIASSNILHDGWWGYSTVGRPVRGTVWGRAGQSYDGQANPGYDVVEIMRDGTVVLCKRRKLTVMTAGSDELQTLCTLPRDIDTNSVVVSPDLSRMAYSTPHSYGREHLLHILNFSTGEDLGCGPGNFPRWSPDSRWVAYTLTPTMGPGSGDGIEEVRLIDRDGGHQRTIGRGRSNNPEFMSWSPDGKSLAYSVPPTYCTRVR